MPFFARSKSLTSLAPAAKIPAAAIPATEPANTTSPTPLPAANTANPNMAHPDTVDPREIAPREVALQGVTPHVAGTKPAVSFEEIVARYHGKVFQLVYRYTGDYEEACDLTQDTFVRAFGAWNEFRGDSQIYTWLYRIAINLCHNNQKKQQRRRRVERWSLDGAPGEGMDYGDYSEAFQVRDERPLPLEVLENFELRARLHEALHELPDNYRTVLVLRDIEGLSYEQIAQITDSSLEAIKSRLFRARNAIRRLMEPYLNNSFTEPQPGARRITQRTSSR